MTDVKFVTLGRPDRRAKARIQGLIEAGFNVEVEILRADSPGRGRPATRVWIDELEGGSLDRNLPRSRSASD